MAAGVSIPLHVVIGVTGTRTLRDEARLAVQVRSVVERIEGLLPPLEATPIHLRALSPLAEGADRLVARELLARPQTDLEVVLPLAKDDYLRDFGGAESRAEFEELLARAQRVTSVPPATSRPEAYERAGRYVVDHCDVLIVLWDGRPASGRGGTAEITEYARKRGCPLYWIDTENDGAIHEELGRGLEARPLDELDRYNREKVSNDEITRETRRLETALAASAERAGLSGEVAHAITEYPIVHFARADLLAQRFRRSYVRAGTLLYAFAAAAVTVATLHGIVWHDDKTVGTVLSVLELALMSLVLGIVWLGGRREWHSKWIDCRFLAERLRNAFFMRLAGIEVPTLRPPRHLSLSYSPTDWMVLAFRALWARRPPGATLDLTRLEGSRKFLVEAWIDDQIEHHRKASERNEKLHKRMGVTGSSLFGLTFAAAALHLVHPPHTLEVILSILVIVLPALGGAIAAIRAHREYHKNANRSREMVGHLQEIRAQMETATDTEAFVSAVEEAEETMAHENADWRIVLRFHELEPPA